jgi:putative peptide zinc metalloprotease protein
MAAFRPESTVMVRPYIHRREGDEVTIGDPERRVYLAIPPEGLDILELLAAGHTIDETTRRYEDKHNETPDIDEFLEIMVAEGFVHTEDQPADTGHGHAHGRRRGKGLSLNWISPRVASRLSSVPVVVFLLAIIGGGVGLAVADFEIMPSPRVFLFTEGNFAVLTLLTFLFAAVGTLIHELAHAVVARAVGLKVTLGVGNLLYVMMAQTDITGIQLAPKRRRYLAFVSGSLTDLATASILLAVIYADRHGAIELGYFWFSLISATIFLSWFRVFAQMFFYVKTDLYYAFATAFNARDLLADTEALLRNVIRRIFGRRHTIEDQSHIPAKERRAIRFYAYVYIVGRALSFTTLFLIFIPIVSAIIIQFIHYASGEPSHMVFIDFLVFGLMTLLVNVGGYYLWIRSLIRGQLRRRAAKRAAAAKALAAAGRPD